MLIPDSFKSIQVLILDQLSVLGLRYLDPFLVLQLITDVMTINHPNMVDNILPSCHHLICSPFLDIVEDMVSQGTAQRFFIF